MALNRDHDRDLDPDRMAGREGLTTKSGEKGAKAQRHKGTKWGEGITTDFTDEHG